MWIQACNMRCKFCYCSYYDRPCAGLTPEGLPPPDAGRVVQLLAESGLVNKITFAGGEPFLRPDLADLLALCKSLGLSTCVVTNATKFAFQPDGSPDANTRRILDSVDQFAMSIDSGVEATRLAMGRAVMGQEVLSNAHYLRVAKYIHERTTISLKINSVVTSHNWEEDMNAFVRELRPKRWKVFQVLPVQGQNDEHFAELEISAEQFAAFCERHASRNPVTEKNDEMTASYLMVDPWGRFFDNATGAYTYSRPILEVGVAEAMGDTSFDPGKYLDRGGEYDL